MTSSDRYDFLRQFELTFDPDRKSIRLITRMEEIEIENQDELELFLQEIVYASENWVRD